MENIYCISGLGADHRFFEQLEIDGYRLVPVPWVGFEATDDMHRYAVKMYDSIPEKEPIIMGLSFGGMLATEIAKCRPVKKIILISSAKTKTELGYDSMLLKKVSAMNIIPTTLFTYPFRPVLYSLGANTDEEKALVRGIIRDSDPKFVKWSIDTLLNWRNQDIPANITHIHGNSDRVIFPKMVRPTHWIEGGSHIMIYNRAAEISKIIGAELAGNT